METSARGGAAGVIGKRPWRWVLALFLLAVAATPMLMRAYYRVDHLPLILQASREQGVDPHLVAAVIFTESRFRHDARSEAGASGLMQLMPETAAEMAEQVGMRGFQPGLLEDPRVNIVLGVAYLKQLERRFHSPELVLAAYNAGPTVVEQWQSERKPVSYSETRHYIRTVLRHQARLAALYPEWSQP